MKRARYEVRQARRGGVSSEWTGQGQEHFTCLRASTLEDGYDLKDILANIEGKEKGLRCLERKISLTVDTKFGSI